jgi:5'-nucleotidase
MTRRLYVDLDGVLADFDAAFPSVFGLDHRSMADDDMWAKINAHPSFFRDLPLCPGAYDSFWGLDWPTEPIILTACPRTNYAAVAKQKRAWVRAHFGDFTVLPVMGGHNKPLFMHSLGDVLIDDLRKNCDAWEKDGGVSVLHRDWGDTLVSVRALQAEVRE